MYLNSYGTPPHTHTKGLDSESRGELTFTPHLSLRVLWLSCRLGLELQVMLVLEGVRAH